MLKTAEPLLYGHYIELFLSHCLHSPALKRSVFRATTAVPFKNILTFRSVFIEVLCFKEFAMKFWVFVMDRRTIKMERMIHKFLWPLRFSNVYVVCFKM